MSTSTINTRSTKSSETVHNKSTAPIDVLSLTSEIGATGLLSDYKDHTDPKYIGPGTWNVIHRRAFKARNHTQGIEFIEFMKDVCHGFPCLVCKGHCTEYIINHPIEDYLDTMVDFNGDRIQLGLFVWTWKFHNAVNARIKKPSMSWYTAYNLYSDTESLVCSKNCLEAADDQPPDGLEHLPSNINKSNIMESNINKSNIPEFNVTTQPFRLIPVSRN